MAAGDTMFDVLCYGTISMESTTRLPYLPGLRRDVPALSEHDALGGEAASVAVPLAAWGLRVLLVGNVIGTDRKAAFIMEELARYPNLDTRYLQQRPDVITPFTRIMVTPQDERWRIAYWFEQSPQVELDQDVVAQAQVLSVDARGGDGSSRAAVVARALGRQVIASDAIWPSDPLVGASNVIVISRAWLQANFPSVYEYDHALELQEQGAGVVIVTDGERPLLLVRADGSAFALEPYQMDNVVDTSGAAHLFKAGLIYGWTRQDWELERKVRFACAAAGLSCQREGSTSQPPGLDEIEALIRVQPR